MHREAGAKLVSLWMHSNTERVSAWRILETIAKEWHDYQEVHKYLSKHTCRFGKNREGLDLVNVYIFLNILANISKNTQNTQQTNQPTNPEELISNNLPCKYNMIHICTHCIQCDYQCLPRLHTRRDAYMHTQHNHHHQTENMKIYKKNSYYINKNNNITTL